MLREYLFKTVSFIVKGIKDVRGDDDQITKGAKTITISVEFLSSSSVYVSGTLQRWEKKTLTLFL